MNYLRELEQVIEKLKVGRDLDSKTSSKLPSGDILKKPITVGKVFAVTFITDSQTRAIFICIKYRFIRVYLRILPFGFSEGLREAATASKSPVNIYGMLK
ncbi:hypothetical protein H6G74_07230 [Nostoc spongiaeforme FACHB-130]|uniref:Uncharacterized protein n=1 Tax=Nostoc spongiaeforme FACHB-130 TaxID=1357510 RepID=A0ABR8FS77_9NOSO|nr:hypothetical protein [Nostoc spongiaeforme]MBD2594122.1 hypothetical protein [Nostoc spongiaeforme FACHB-130]